jgi:hypothetical protein
MKTNLLLIVLLFGCMMPISSKAQCDVSKDIIEGAAIGYYGKHLSIYRNEDLENGIQTAYLQMMIVQKEKNSTFLKFAVVIIVGSSGSKPQISPNKVQFEFMDGSRLELNTNNITSEFFQGTKLYLSTFQITKDKFMVFQKETLSSIKAIDTGTNNSLAFHPDNSQAILRQSNCIAEAVN